MDRDLYKLRKWCIARHQEGWSVSDVCSHARISRMSFYCYLERHRQGGAEALRDCPRLPITIHRTPDYIADMVIELRRQHGWGPNKIEH